FGGLTLPAAPATSRWHLPPALSWHCRWLVGRLFRNRRRELASVRARAPETCPRLTHFHGPRRVSCRHRQHRGTEDLFDAPAGARWKVMSGLPASQLHTSSVKCVRRSSAAT